MRIQVRLISAEGAVLDTMYVSAVHGVDDPWPATLCYLVPESIRQNIAAPEPADPDDPVRVSRTAVDATFDHIDASNPDLIVGVYRLPAFPS